MIVTGVNICDDYTILVTLTFKIMVFYKMRFELWCLKNNVG